MGYIYLSQKVAICSLWTVCPCSMLSRLQRLTAYFQSVDSREEIGAVRFLKTKQGQTVHKQRRCTEIQPLKKGKESRVLSVDKSRLIMKKGQTVYRSEVIELVIELYYIIP